MAYNVKLAEKVRTYLANIPKLAIEEKKMFGGLAFLINGKMCVNVSGERAYVQVRSRIAATGRK